MPYPFTLPTTSAFSFSSSFNCESHPSLPLNASTRRGVVRDTLKAHKRLPPSSQPANLSSVVSSLTGYLPYLLALDAGLNHRQPNIRVSLKTPPTIEWRPTLADSALLPGGVKGIKETSRIKVRSLEYEISFALSCLANTYTLQARAALHPLYVSSSAPVGTQQRQAAIAAATRNLLDAASIHDYLANRTQNTATTPPCADLSPAASRAQCELALAEATLLAVLKDDPYPAIVAQDRNKNDTEWMYKAPDIPKVRAHLFARLCLAAAEHAAHAHSLCAAGGKINDKFVRYLEDLRRTGRAKACRFFGIDAELGGQTGNAIGWLHAGLQELGVEPSETSKKSGSSSSIGGLGRLRKEWVEKREDKKVERSLDWGADAGRLEETRVLEMLEAKWTKQNDTILTQAVPPAGSLLAQMPTGREMHNIKPFQPPQLDADSLEAMRAPPDRADDVVGGYPSSDEETTPRPVGAFPGTQSEYRTGTPGYY